MNAALMASLAAWSSSFAEICPHALPAEWSEHEHAPRPAEPLELLVALRQRNLPVLEELVRNVSDPAHAQYGQYMSAAALGELLRPSAAGAAAVRRWLHEAGATAVRTVATGDFVRATVAATNATLLFGGAGSGAASVRAYTHSALGGRLLRVAPAPGAAPLQLPPAVAPHVQLLRGLCDLPAAQPRRRARRHREAAALAAAKAEGGRAAAPPAPAGAAAAAPCTFDWFSFPTLVAAGDGVLNASLSWSCSDGASVSSLLSGFGVSLRQGGKTLTATASSAEVVCGTPSWVGGNPSCLIGTALPGLANHARASGLALTPLFKDGSKGTVLEHEHFIVPTPWATPARLRALYSVGNSSSSSGSGSGSAAAPRKGSMAVVEFGASFDPKDAALFASVHGEPAPSITVVGSNNPDNPDTEGTMDIEMITAMGRGVPAQYWGYSWKKWILDWAADVSAAASPPLVFSLSFGEPESTADPAEVTRMNTELAKMSARGITVVATAGDWGTNDLVNCSRFWSDFPSSSPYTLSAGGTLITEGKAAAEAACSTEVGCAYTTGGGFSRKFAQPAWQKDAVAAYLGSAAVNASQKQLFNSAGRGYNDVAAVGNNVRMVIDGRLTVTGVGGGTSASGPIVAGLIALLNAERLDAGKAPLGLANPLLYQASAAKVGTFNAIGTTGGSNSNQCDSEPSYTCCDRGLLEASGWDPLSGLGSINFTALASYISVVLRQ